MPHLVIEYATPLEKEVDITGLMAGLHTCLGETGVFDVKDIKTRAKGYASFIVGAGANGFVHVSLSLLSGRPLDVRQNLTETLFLEMQKWVPTSAKLSVEIKEIERETYQKN